MAHSNFELYTPSRRLVSIIIPTLNEQLGIEKTISSILKSSQILERLRYDIEILVVDGNSSDLTREVALKMGAKVILEKKGYGRACKTGFAAAKGEIIVTVDADDTYPAEMIPQFIQQLNEKSADFITINRFPKMERGAMSYSHRLGNKILSVVMRLLYSIPVRDSQSGMWIMRRSFLSRINLYSDDWSLPEEIKIVAFTFFKSFEINDGGYYRKRVGVSKLSLMQHGWRNLIYLFQYRCHLKYALKVSSFDLEEPHRKNLLSMI